jgi:hypothetical protein
MTSVSEDSFPPTTKPKRRPEKSAFASYIENALPLSPLPCAHTCEGINFRAISTERQLVGGVKDKMVYLFYGRPAYRPSKTELSTRNLAYAPVTIILKRERPITPAKIYPFDSGAFETELYRKHFHPLMTLPDFLLNDPLETASKVVSRFFGSNQNYYLGTTDLPSPPDLEFEAVGYHNLIKDPGPSEFDDRRGSVEIQVADRLKLAEDSVELVVLPTQYLSNAHYRNTILGFWKADVRGYTLHHDRPNSYIVQIRSIVQEFYEAKGYL